MTASTENKKQDGGAINNAVDVIERFGGIRPMATKMSVPVTTVQGWKKRNVIPGNRRDDVLRAAASNNINIADIIEKGAANENTNDFEAAVAEATRTDEGNKMTDVKHEQAVEAGRQTIMQEEFLAKKLKASERRAVQKSALTTIILIGLAVGFAVVLLWPSQARIAAHDKRINALEGSVGAVEKEQSLLQKLLPDDWQMQWSRMQEQATDLQGKMAAMATIAQTLTDEGAGSLPQRITALEGQMQALGAPGEITALFSKLEQMQQTIEGQTQLSGAVADLGALVKEMQGEMSQFDGVLQKAQGEDDALGQTLEGVAPTDLKAAALLVALTKFRSSLNRSAPFEEDLLLLQGMTAKDDPELNAAIERLAPRAQAGVLSPEGLSQELRGMAGEIVVASLQGEDVSMKEKAMARLNEVLQVQKDGELVTGTDTQASIARAQKMLDEGNIVGAVTELQGLQGDAAQVAQPWMDKAQATMMAQKVQDMVSIKVGSSIGIDDMEAVVRTIQKLGGGTPVHPVDLGGAGR